MKWFAVQTVVRHRKEGRGRAIYEERLVIYRARTASQASARAKREADMYLAENPGFTIVGKPSMFILNAKESDLDGAEVWSGIHSGSADGEKFWAERYKKYSLE